MKLPTTIAALALIGAAASTSTVALAENQQLPHALTAPKPSFMHGTATAKARTVSFQGKTGTVEKALAPPPTSAPKTNP